MRNGLWAFAAGFFVTGLLPSIESVFGVLTGISLLELGDITHPLLQELVRRRRAPTTIRSPWARSPKPRPRPSAPRACWFASGRTFTTSARCSSRDYFIENQGSAATIGTIAGPGHEHADHHRPCQGRRRPGPAASSARADHRPHRAASRHDAGRVFLSPRQSSSNEANPDGGIVPEEAFRYPGPKPQTSETAS